MTVTCTIPLLRGNTGLYTRSNGIYANASKLLLVAELEILMFLVCVSETVLICINQIENIISSFI